MTRFHYAFKVKDIGSTIEFYHRILGCELGRQTIHWVDFNFFGHQLSAHVSDKPNEPDYCGQVGGIAVPIPHFGCILEPEKFKAVKERLLSFDIKFIIEPHTRYQDQKGEQETMFILDYSNNPIEFKSFKDDTEVFD